MGCGLIVICRLLLKITQRWKATQWKLTTVCVSFIWFLSTPSTGGQEWYILCVLHRWISGIWLVIIISDVQIGIAKASMPYNRKRNIITPAAIFTLLIAVEWKRTPGDVNGGSWLLSLLNGLDCSLNQKQEGGRVDLWESCLSPSILPNAGPGGNVSHVFLHVLSHSE